MEHCNRLIMLAREQQSFPQRARGLGVLRLPDERLARGARGGLVFARCVELRGPRDAVAHEGLVEGAERAAGGHRSRYAVLARTNSLPSMGAPCSWRTVVLLTATTE